MLYENPAGRETQLLDGNLNQVTTPQVKTALVIGTAERGPSNYAYVVTESSKARSLYGDDGTLIQGMFEVQDAGAPEKLFRIGGTPAILEDIADAITVKTIEKADLIEEEYAISWQVTEGVGTLKVWRINDTGTTTLVYEWSTDNALASQDGGEVSVIVSGAIDLDAETFGTEFIGISMAELDDSVSGGLFPLTKGTSGIAPTRKELYALLYEAYLTLFNESFDYITVMDVYLDDPNIADVPEETKAGWNFDDPVVLAGQIEDYFGTTDILTYAKVTENTDGTFTWSWSNTLEDDYHEVNFAYQLANFCHQMTRNQMMVHGTVGVNPPASLTDQAEINKWIGKLPTYSLTQEGVITADGSGLLGNKYMAGTSAREEGYFWATETEWLDDPDVQQDRNGVDLDIGKYITVFADWRYYTNRYAAIINPTRYFYIASGAAAYCGYISSLDPKIAPTAKQIPDGARVPYRIGISKVDDLVYARYVILRPDADVGGHVVARGSTAARWTSDYKEFSTFNIIKEVDDRVRRIVKRYLGRSFNALMMESLQTDLNKMGKDLLEQGYIKGPFYEFKPVQTALQAANGQLIIFTTVTPAFELIRVTHVIGMKLQ